MQPSDLASKRIDLLREIVPNFRRLSALANTGGGSFAQEVDGIRAAAAILNMEANILEIRSADDIAAALATLKGRTDALYVLSEPLVNANKTDDPRRRRWRRKFRPCSAFASLSTRAG